MRMKKGCNYAMRVKVMWTDAMQQQQLSATLGAALVTNRRRTSAAASAVPQSAAHIPVLCLR